VWGEFGPKGPPAMAEFGGYKFLLEQTAQLRPMSAAEARSTSSTSAAICITANSCL